MPLEIAVEIVKGATLIVVQRIANRRAAKDYPEEIWSFDVRLA